jgi:hypothetical protein
VTLCYAVGKEIPRQSQLARFRNIFLNAKNCLTRIFSYLFHGLGIPGVLLFFAYSNVASQHVPGDFMMSGVRLPGSLQRGPFMVQPKQAGKVENQLYIKKINNNHNDPVRQS